jgi:hypothetical protein
MRCTIQGVGVLFVVSVMIVIVVGVDIGVHNNNMPKTNLNFIRGLNGTIIIVLGSTQLRHVNAKTL